VNNIQHLCCFRFLRICAVWIRPSPSNRPLLAWPWVHQRKFLCVARRPHNSTPSHCHQLILAGLST